MRTRTGCVGYITGSYQLAAHLCEDLYVQLDVHLTVYITVDLIVKLTVVVSVVSDPQNRPTAARLLEQLEKASTV